MKCIIPCGGFGTRLHPWSKFICKELLPVNGVPVICHVLNEILICEEVDEIVFVSSPDKELMKKIILDFFPQYVSKITFINDNTHKGLDNSIMLAKEKCQNADATILCWPDCFNDENEIKKLIKNFKGEALIGVVEVDDVRAYGNIIVNKQNKITKIIQKPKTNDTGSKLVFWGKAIVSKSFWNTYNGNLDETFMNKKIFKLTSKPYDTGNKPDFAKANWDLTFKK